MPSYLHDGYNRPRPPRSGSVYNWCVTKSPSISIVIPAHNARHTIGMALSSLYGQTFEDWETIVVDDGSTDGTANLVRAIGDSRVRIIRQNQSGAAAARNRGLTMTRGCFIGFLDADDFLFPEYLDRSLQILAESPTNTLVTNNAYFLTPGGISPRLVRHGQTIPRSLRKQQTAILRSNFVSIMSLFPRKLLEDVGDFDSSLERAEDWDFWIRASFAGWRIAHQRQPMAFINRTGESLTSATEKVARSESEILRKTARSQPLTRKQSNQVAKRLVIGEPSELRSESLSALRSRDYLRASRLHLTATQLETRSPRALARALAFRIAPRTVGRLLRRGLV